MRYLRHRREVESHARVPPFDRRSPRRRSRRRRSGRHRVQRSSAVAVAAPRAAWRRAGRNRGAGRRVHGDLRRRDETKDVGVILLTARRDERDRIKGLSLGADDYLAKPFSPQELVLRVGAVLRRLAAPPVAAGGVLAAGPISLDKSAHRASVDGVEVELTAIEFKLLRTLIEREGRV